MPLDRSGVVPGSVNLFVERRAGDPAQAPVIVLAGGPGQSATSVTSDWLSLFSPVLGRRALVVFDQRGTGNSGALSCSDLALANSDATYAAAVTKCATQLGDKRGLYRTSDSVEDIEAVRQAIGADKIALAGVSYGTKVALAYAARYPAHVERLVLDSIVPLDQDQFHRETFQALAPVLRDVCGHHCSSISPDPSADLAAVVQRLKGSPLTGRAVLGSGKRVPFFMTESDLLSVLISGDLDPVLRAAEPSALHAARAGDPAPLLRLELWAFQGGGQPTDSIFSVAANLATLCEESPLPWARETPPETHLAAAQAAITALGPDAFAPFDAATALAAPPVSECVPWPQTLTAPALSLPSSLPDVPVLILSGKDDLRTPTSNARTVAAAFPHASLLEVPGTGHSVLTTDFSGCAERGLVSFFAGATPEPCIDSLGVLIPAPMAPASLARETPARGTSGRAGRTAAAVLATVDDVRRSAFEASFAIGTPLAQIEVGGLRSGRAIGRLGRILTLKKVEYVPGVLVSGTISVRPALAGTLRVSGRVVGLGTLTIARGVATGRLAGKPVRAVLPR